jgi:hypothetical protein
LIILFEFILKNKYYVKREKEEEEKKENDKCRCKKYLLKRIKKNGC